MIDLAEALSGRAGGRGVRALLRAAPHREVLRSLLEPTATLGRCRLRRVKFKPGRKLSAYYDVSFGASHSRTRAVAVTWTSTVEAPPDVEAAESALEEEARERGLVEPFRRLGTAVADEGLRLHITPLDPAFATLVRLVDPAYVRGLLERAVGHGTALAEAPAVHTIRFRPGQRHVLRYTVPGRAGRTLFAKLERPGTGLKRGATAHAARAGARVAAAVADVLASSGPDLRAATPTARVDEDCVVLYDLVPGQPLTRALESGSADVGLALGQAGSLLRVLHRDADSVGAQLQSRDHHAEIAATRRACEHIATLLPHVTGSVDAVLGRVGDILDEPSAEPSTFAHGDFKSDHLLVAPGTMTLIDFDSCVRAEPAYDLGKFLADLRFWFFSWSRPALAAAQQQFLDGYALADTDPRLARARAYEALLLVKLAARRVRVDDVDWATRTSMLVAQAGRLVEAAARTP